MARWQKPEPLVPYIDTFGFDLPKSAPLSTSDPWTSSVPSVPWEASSPMAIRESMPSAVSPSLFETTDIEELRETIMREEKEKAAEAYAQKEQELQECNRWLSCRTRVFFLVGSEEKMNALKEQHRLRCDELLRQKEKEREELGAKEAEIAALKEEGQFQLEKLLSQQQEQEERLQIQEKAAEARATEKKLQERYRTPRLGLERLAEKDSELDTLRKERRIRDELLSCKDQEMEDVIREERLQQQDVRRGASRGTGGAADGVARRLAGLRGKDLELEALRDQRQLQEELVCRKDQEVQGLLEEERRQEELSGEGGAEQQSLNEMELRAEIDRLKEQNQAACQEKEARLELEMAAAWWRRKWKHILTEELADQKGSLDAQIAALIQRLDEEQAERIRQGARAESLEKDLEALRGRHLEEKELRRGREGQASWWRFTQRLSAEAEVAALRTSQRSLRSEVVMLRAGKAQERGAEMGLLESVALFEGDLEKVSDRHAQLIGHVNKKQKIRYTVKLKEECAQLRAELSKARHRLNQLEGHRRQDGLMSALASLGYETPALSFTGKADRAGGTSRRPGFERVVPRKLQEGTLQRLDADFRHLVCLVQSALGEDGRSDLPFAQLLQALREVQQAKAEAKASAPASAARHEGAMASPVRVLATSPAKAFASPSKSTATVSPSSLRSPKVSPVKEKRASLFEDQENLEANCHTREPLLGEAQKALAKINQCIGSGRKLYGQPVSDSYAFFQVLQRKALMPLSTHWKTDIWGQRPSDAQALLEAKELEEQKAKEALKAAYVQRLEAQEQQHVQQMEEMERKWQRSFDKKCQVLLDSIKDASQENQRACWKSVWEEVKLDGEVPKAETGDRFMNEA
eukprot:g6394.t1